MGLYRSSYVATPTFSPPLKCKALWGANGPGPDRAYGEVYDCCCPCGPFDDPFQEGYFHLTKFDCLSTPPEPNTFYYEIVYQNQLGERFFLESIVEPTLQYVTDNKNECDVLKYGTIDNKTVIGFVSQQGFIQEEFLCGVASVLQSKRIPIEPE